MGRRGDGAAFMGAAARWESQGPLGAAVSELREGNRELEGRVGGIERQAWSFSGLKLSES